MTPIPEEPKLNGSVPHADFPFSNMHPRDRDNKGFPRNSPRGDSLDNIPPQIECRVPELQDTRYRDEPTDNVTIHRDPRGHGARDQPRSQNNLDPRNGGFRDSSSRERSSSPRNHNVLDLDEHFNKGNSNRQPSRERPPSQDDVRARDARDRYDPRKNEKGPSNVKDDRPDTSRRDNSRGRNEPRRRDDSSRRENSRGRNDPRQRDDSSRRDNSRGRNDPRRRDDSSKRDNSRGRNDPRRSEDYKGRNDLRKRDNSRRRDKSGERNRSRREDNTRVDDGSINPRKNDDLRSDPKKRNGSRESPHPQEIGNLNNPSRTNSHNEDYSINDREVRDVSKSPRNTKEPLRERDSREVPRLAPRDNRREIPIDRKRDPRKDENYTRDIGVDPFDMRDERQDRSKTRDKRDYPRTDPRDMRDVQSHKRDSRDKRFDPRDEDRRYEDRVMGVDERATDLNKTERREPEPTHDQNPPSNGIPARKYVPGDPSEPYANKLEENAEKEPDSPIYSQVRQLYCSFNKMF